MSPGHRWRVASEFSSYDEEDLSEKAIVAEQVVLQHDLVDDLSQFGASVALTPINLCAHRV
jgi:hypothetical protein